MLAVRARKSLAAEHLHPYIFKICRVTIYEDERCLRRLFNRYDSQLVAELQWFNIILRGRYIR